MGSSNQIESISCISVSSQDFEVKVEYRDSSTSDWVLLLDADLSEALVTPDDTTTYDVIPFVARFVKFNILRGNLEEMDFDVKGCRKKGKTLLYFKNIFNNSS